MITLKKTGLASLLVIGSLCATAQNKGQVRVKTVKIVNGVKTVTDTIIQEGALHLPDLDVLLSETEAGDSLTGKKRMYIKTIDIRKEGDSSDSTLITKLLSPEDLDTEALEKHISINGEEITIHEGGNEAGKKQAIIIKSPHSGKGNTEKNGDKKQVIIIRKKTEVQELSADDKKLLKQKDQPKGAELKASKLNFYPNPGDGKFNLSFELEQHGNTAISIYNAEGKIVYQETLSNFTGKYNKEIDISNEAKGIYFIKVSQGESNLFRKIIME